MIKTVFIDTETTGVPNDYQGFGAFGLHQISMIYAEDGVVKDRFEANMRPFFDDVIQEKAIEISGKTLDEIQNQSLPSDAFIKFYQFLTSKIDKYNKKDKAHFIAYNSSFDTQVVRCWIKKCWNGAFPDSPSGLNYFFGSMFWTPSIDVMTLSALALMDVRGSLENFKLRSVCERLGLVWDEDQAHNASYDVEMTYQVYNKIMESIGK